MKSKKGTKIHTNKAIVGIAMTILSVLIFFGFTTNYIPFVYNVVRCGRLPIESIKFAAAYSYHIPGDQRYGVHPFSDYNFCTEKEIEGTNGYSHFAN